MFVFDVKEIFQQKIFDILSLLIIIHVGTVMISFLIKCYHIYFKNYAEMSEEMEVNSVHKYPPNPGAQAKAKCKKKEEEILFNEESESSDEDYFNLIDNLKSFLDLIPPEISNKKKMSNKTLGSRDICHLKKVLKNKSRLKNKKLSNETQTNITINPQVNIDYSCPKLILAEVSSGIPIENKSSSECFQSASSGNSDTICIDDENEYSPIFRHLGCCDLLKYRKIDLTNTTKIAQNQDLCLKKQCRPNGNSVLKKDLGKLHENCGIQLTQENKIIEMAITEFEKELKPIKDQIKLLKECLNDFEEFDAELNIPSDFSSSATGTLGHCESYSGVMSTTCSTILNGNISNSYTVLGKKHAPFESESKFTNNLMNTVKRLPHLLSNKKEGISDKFSNVNEKVSFSNDVRHSTGSDNFQKRSPMAEMYIKLSQSNSKTASTLGKRQHKLVHSEDGKTVTCHINLNVNIGRASTTNMQKTNWPKERNLLPVVSGPEDIFGKPSDTHVCLRPV